MLGVTSRPITSATAPRPVGNAATATGYSATPATTSGGGTTRPTTAQAMNTIAAQNGVSVATVQNVQALASQAAGPAVASNLMTASAGGAISAGEWRRVVGDAPPDEPGCR